MRLGPWNEGFVVEDAWVVVRPLTHRFDGNPGHIFFISIGGPYVEYIHNIAKANEILSDYSGNPALRKWFYSRLKTPYDWCAEFWFDKFLDGKVPVLGLPGLDQAISDAFMVSDRPLQPWNRNMDMVQIAYLGDRISPLLQS